MGSAWLGEHVEFRSSRQVVLFSGETDVPGAVHKWLLPFFYSGIFLPMNTYCLLKSTHPLFPCLGYNSHGRCAVEVDITRLFGAGGQPYSAPGRTV